MALTDLVVPTGNKFVGIDSGAITSGRFLNAALMRAMCENANLLLRGKHQTLLSLAAESTGFASTHGINHVGHLTWNRLLPGVHVVPKMPGLNKATLYIMAKIPTNNVVWLQVETLRSAPNLSAGYSADPRTFALIGTNVQGLYTLADIPIDEGPYERFGFWLKGVGTTTAGDHTVYGGDENGRGKFLERNETTATWFGYTPTAGTQTWNDDYSGNPTWAEGHYLWIQDGTNIFPGNTLFQSSIVAVPESNKLRLNPPPADDALSRYLATRYFQIRKLPTIQVAALTIVAQPRTT